MKLQKIFIILLLIILFLTPTTTYCNNPVENDDITYSIEDVNSEQKLIEKKLDILSEAVILIDSKSGTEIYSKNKEKKMYPASTTKILTAILAIEKGNLSDITTVSYNAISLIPPGHSSAYLSEGEQISVQNLLEVLLVHSANDAANVLAEYISGSIDEFVNLMNNKAKELGCTNTNFVNTNGIHDENHYSTATDLAIISKYCMQNKTFRKIIAMENCIIPATNKSDTRVYNNTNDSILKNSEYYREDCIGGKTGYTSQAKNCLISVSINNEVELITVLLYSPHLADRYSDLNLLLDYGYDVYPLLNIQSEAIVEELEPNESSISTENLFSQSFLENLIRSDMFLNVLRILLILTIFILLSIILSMIKKSGIEEK